MKKLFLTVLVIVFAITGIAHAALTKIGTAQFSSMGIEYNLIMDDGYNGNSIIWLDYSKPHSSWATQMKWAADLNVMTALVCNTPGYDIDWDLHSWRLPTSVDGPVVKGYDGTTTAGYNVITSELGHLFYTELGNRGYRNTDGSYNTAPNTGLRNKGDFIRLSFGRYWSLTESQEYPNAAWNFNTSMGDQDVHVGDLNEFLGIAVWGPQVSAVPVPGAIWLLGSGLIAIMGIMRRKKKE